MSRITDDLCATACYVSAHYALERARKRLRLSDDSAEVEEINELIPALEEMDKRQVARAQRRNTMQTFTTEDVEAGNIGVCLACGAETYGVEPDAREYTCEACGAKKVYGLEEALVMGKINIEIEEEEE